MSPISSTVSRTQSPLSDPEFPPTFRRERTLPPTVEDRAELPNGKEDYEMGISPPFERPPSKNDHKGRIYYKPIAEKRKLGYMSTAALIINKMIGTGIFSKPSDILRSTGSKGGSMFMWVTGGFMTLSGLVYSRYAWRFLCSLLNIIAF